MMKQLLAGFLAVALAFPASAGMFSVSGSDDDCTLSRSKAWCLLDRAGLSDGAEDVPRDKLPEGFDDRSVLETPEGLLHLVVGASGAVGLATTAARTTAHVTSGVMLLGSVLFFMGKRFDPKTKMHSVLVIPKEDAGDDPFSYAEKVFIDASVKGLGGEKATYIPKNPKSEIIYEQKGYYRVEGGRCANINCRVMFNQFGMRKMVEVKPPKWLDLEQKEGWANKYYDATGLHIYFNDEYAPIEIYRLVSAELPTWAYLFVPAGKGDNKIPMYLNKGNPLLFISPK